MKKSGLIFVYLIIVVALCLSGCLQQGTPSNSSSLTTPPAPVNHTPANPAPANPAPMNRSAASGPTTNEVIIYLMAKNIAFNNSTITVPAGANVTVYFDNQDSGTPHNFAVYDSPSASQTIFQGKIITGPAKATYTFTAPITKPGTYYFQMRYSPDPDERPVHSRVIRNNANDKHISSKHIYDEYVKGQCFDSKRILSGLKSLLLFNLP